VASRAFLGINSAAFDVSVSKRASTGGDRSETTKNVALRLNCQPCRRLNSIEIRDLDAESFDDLRYEERHLNQGQGATGAYSRPPAERYERACRDPAFVVLGEPVGDEPVGGVPQQLVAVDDPG